MTELVRPGVGLIFMKVGTHAQEPLEDIIERKRKEIDEAGYALWGYGGNTCHPLSTVQPFARLYERRNGAIYLCMEPMDSKHFAEQARASEYSVDGLYWEPIHPAINVLGSRYAMAIKSLEPTEFELPLDRTRVAMGMSAGRAGSRYIAGRVDKACLEVVDGELTDEPRVIHIGLTAQVVDPYAVLLRN